MLAIVEASTPDGQQKAELNGQRETERGSLPCVPEDRSRHIIATESAGLHFAFSEYVQLALLIAVILIILLLFKYELAEA